MKWRSGTLDDLYFEWLYEQIADIHEIDPRRTYWDLMRTLYCTKFLYFVPNDDNRAQDGLELRELFIEMEELHHDPYWDSLPCSIFEMLVAFARRTEFEGGRSIDYWFWMFIHNMDILIDDETFKRTSRTCIDRIERAATRLNRRLYSDDGRDGGLFVVNNFEGMMPGIEMWYQMSAYLREEV